MKGGTLKIHTENILPIIKKWLYSDKDIFVRELVSNASDALSKIKMIGGDGPFQIDLTLNKENRTLTIQDTGIGMTAEEVEKYIAQVAFSGAEEFLGKYTNQNENEQIIGHFGLGFYSAYMVAEKVEIDTLSHLENSEPVFWGCDGSINYILGRGKQETRGTSITLFIDKDNEEYLEEDRLSQILQRYCAFLPFPIKLNGKLINEKEPLFVKSASQCSDEEYIKFYRELYPLEPDPIFWIHLSVDYPFHLKGILYFPKIQKKLDWTHNNIKLFCNRVFVSDNCKDLLPEYLTCLRGTLDSPDIPLNVSRSYLQMDRTVRQLSTHISKKIADRLLALYQTEKNKFFASWEEIEMVIKLGLLQDEKFYERSKEFLSWKTTQGEWTTLEEYRAQHGNKVFYTTEGHNTQCLELYKAQGIEVLIANSHIDNALMNYLEDKERPLKFQRVDGAIENTLLDPKREKTLLDAEGKTEAAQIADFIRRALSSDKVQVEAKSLASDTVPALIVRDEELRRLRDYMTLTGQPLPPNIADKHTFVVNTNSKLIALIYKLREKDSALAQEMAEHVYDLSLLSHKELSADALPKFVERAGTLIERLLEK
ncbi:MAG: molecular chaperone HtpG [Chlamydiota bacterium]